MSWLLPKNRGARMIDNVNQRIAALQPYKPGKPIEELARELGINDIVKLASNENPLGPSQAVLDAVVEASAQLPRYPDGSGFELKQSLAEHLRVDTAQITLGNGSNDVLDLIARVALQPGSEAIIAEHSFVVYRLAVTCCGGDLVTVPAKDYGADLDAMLAAVTERTRVVFLANPNNPTGTWVAAAAIENFLQQLRPDVWVVLDEAYFEYVDEVLYGNGLTLLDKYPNLIVTRTFSKIYGLASVRLGYSVSSPEFADLLNRARQPFNVNGLAMSAGLAAIADDDYVQRSRALNQDGMAQVTQGLTAQGYSFIPSVGNFVAFDSGRAGADVFDDLLRQGVIVRPIAEYGLPNHVRVSIGLPIENERFLSALAALGPG